MLTIEQIQDRGSVDLLDYLNAVLPPSADYTIRDGFAGITIQFAPGVLANVHLNQCISAGLDVRQMTPDTYKIGLDLR